MREIEKIHAAVERIVASGGRGLLVTVLSTHGSTYRRAGACCVIAEGGEVTGSISGGCVERDIAERARSWLADFTPRTVTYDSSSAEDIVFGLGLGCRGKIEMRVQPFDSAHRPELPAIPEPRRVAIFGRGSDVDPVAALATAVGWRVTVFRDYDEPDLTGFDAAVIMTHNFLHDLALLERSFASAVRYVGLLGPRSRGEDLLTQMGGATDAMRARLHNPIGLDLGGDSPDDIALSIVAEIQAALHERDGVSLRKKSGAIHAAVRTVAVVLAAGGSSRLGRPKQTLQYKGRPLLEHAIATARAAGCDETLVVVQPEAAGTIPGSLILNPEWREGIASSIRVAVDAAAGARILFTLCDQPLVTPEHLRALLAVDAPIVATAYSGIAGVPAVFAPRFADELRALTGDRGARAVMEAHRDVLATVGFEDAAVDIDTPADYRKL